MVHFEDQLVLLVLRSFYPEIYIGDVKYWGHTYIYDENLQVDTKKNNSKLFKISYAKNNNTTVKASSPGLILLLHQINMYLKTKLKKMLQMPFLEVSDG